MSFFKKTGRAIGTIGRAPNGIVTLGAFGSLREAKSLYEVELASYTALFDDVARLKDEVDYALKRIRIRGLEFASASKLSDLIHRFFMMGTTYVAKRK